MRALRKKWDSDERLELKDILPLETPLCIHLEPSSYCNLQCRYCPQSLSNNAINNLGFNRQMMRKETFYKIVDDCKKFNNKIKNLRISGTGEPLLNKDLPEMLAYAKKQDVFKRISVFTNALLLNESLSNELVKSVDIFRISIQGLDEVDYKNNANIQMDFNCFFQNLEYLYKIKKDAKIFIKVLDFAILGRENDFYDKFGNICDQIDIEKVIHAHHHIDYSEIIPEAEGTSSSLNKGVEICPYPFFQLTVSSFGEVFACCSTFYRLIAGNVNTENLIDIWHGEGLKTIRIDMLSKTAAKYELCKGCSVCREAMRETDNIDSVKDKLLILYRDNL